MHGSILPVTTPLDTSPGLCSFPLTWWSIVYGYNRTIHYCVLSNLRGKRWSHFLFVLCRKIGRTITKISSYMSVIFSLLLNLTASYWNCSFCCLAASLDIAFQWFPMFDLISIVCSFIRLILFLSERLRLLPAWIKCLMIAKITFSAFHKTEAQLFDHKITPSV